MNVQLVVITKRVQGDIALGCNVPPVLQYTLCFIKSIPLEKQESCAIAKTTARCALYIPALKILESP